MNKKVVYNGGKDSWKSCSSPDLLEKGKIYTLVKEEVHSFHTNYVLQEFPGEKFNSVWFDEIQDDKVKKIYFGYLVEVPKKGNRVQLRMVDGNRLIKTSVLERVENYYEKRIWVVETKNSIYVLQ